MRICLFNDAAEALFGYPRAEAIGMALDNLLPANARARHAEHIAGFAESRVHAKFMNDRRTLFGLTKDGREVPLEISILAHRAPGPARFSAIIRDLRQRHAYEARLQASERKFRGLFETSSAILILADADGHMLDVNASGGDFFARPRQDLLQRSLMSPRLWGDADTAATVAVTVKTAIRHGKSGALLALRKNNATRRLDFIVHRFGKAAAGDATALFIEGRDVTPLFEAHHALARQSAEKPAE
ncbi:MAG: hypothetical protein Tsb0016_24550 [Sphingomonadales bacterium]